MRTIEAFDLVSVGFDSGVCVYGDDARKNIKWDLPPEVDGFSAICAMRDICNLIGAESSAEFFDGIADVIQLEGDESTRPSSDEMLVYYKAFRRELDSRLFVHIPTERSSYYQNGSLLGRGAKTAFPNAAQELRSAGNAYACGLSVACVFHCMRALEHGLASLARDVGLQWTKEQWHTIIEAIESKIENERRTLRSGTPRDERLKYLSSAAKEFFYFKDGWRNYVTHNRVSYEAPQALEVLDHVRSFVEQLSKHLKE